MGGLAAICVVVMVYGLLAKRLDKTFLTAPMVFLGLGVVLEQAGLVSHDRAHALLDPIAEVALIVLLFLDAAQTDLKALRQQNVWPARMLLVGLPLAIVIGTFVAWTIMPGMGLALAALAAAILSPTDAALGQAVVTNPDVPERSRRALTVESGMNDGLALPIILMLASVAAMEMSHSPGEWLVFGIKQISFGILAGIGLGTLGGLALLKAKDLDTTSDTTEGIAALALAGGTYLISSMIGGNGFIAAFVSGLCFGHVVGGRCKFVFEFTESEGQILAWLAFLLIGGALVPHAVANLTWPMLALILLSLFVVRPLAIWLSLMGTDAKPISKLFFGWFGPRGLATALFALIVLEELPPEVGESVLSMAVNAVWISALLHGATAGIGGRWYGRKMAQIEASDEQPQERRQEQTETTALNS